MKLSDLKIIVTGGAQGIAMGTRFLMTTDSGVPPATLKRYLEALDGEKVFFLKADIDSFEHKYATSFDEAIEQLQVGGVVGRRLLVRQAL